MFQDFFSNRWFIGALAFFIFSVVGGSLYIWHVERQGIEDLVQDEEGVNPLTGKRQPTAEVPEGNTSQGGNFHEDDTWHTERHAPVASEDVQFSDVDVQFNLDFLDNLPADVRSRIQIDYDYLLMTDEERARRDREQNQLIIDTIANKPVFAEVHKLMTENPFPYSPEVQAKLHEAQMQVTEKQNAYALEFAEIREKMLDPNISGKAYAELARKQKELVERYHGGQ